MSVRVFRHWWDFVLKARLQRSFLVASKVQDASRSRLNSVVDKALLAKGWTANLDWLRASDSNSNPRGASGISRLRSARHCVLLAERRSSFWFLLGCLKASRHDFRVCCTARPQGFNYKRSHPFVLQTTKHSGEMPSEKYICQGLRTWSSHPSQPLRE